MLMTLQQTISLVNLPDQIKMMGDAAYRQVAETMTWEVFNCGRLSFATIGTGLGQ